MINTKPKKKERTPSVAVRFLKNLAPGESYRFFVGDWCRTVARAREEYAENPDISDMSAYSALILDLADTVAQLKRERRIRVDRDRSKLTAVGITTYAENSDISDMSIVR